MTLAAITQALSMLVNPSSSDISSYPVNVHIPHPRIAIPIYLRSTLSIYSLFLETDGKKMFSVSVTSILCPPRQSERISSCFKELGLDWQSNPLKIKASNGHLIPSSQERLLSLTQNPFIQSDDKVWL